LQENGQPSIYVLRDSFKEECFDAAWKADLGWVILMMLLYPIGIPVFLGCLLFKFRSHFHEPYVRYCLGFIYEGYLPEFWFWELIDTIHKLFIASIMSLVPANAQLPLATGILGAYLCLLLWVKPYLRNNDNQFHLMTQAVMYLVVFSFLSRETVGIISLGSEEDLLVTTLLLILCWATVVHLVVRMCQYVRKRKEAVLQAIREITSTSKVSRVGTRASSRRGSQTGVIDAEERNSESAETSRRSAAAAEQPRPSSAPAATESRPDFPAAAEKDDQPLGSAQQESSNKMSA
jgi:hypothetical protein